VHTFTVMTFNLLVSRRDYSGAVDSILAEDPDIVALQELTEPARRTIGRFLRRRFPFQALRPAAGFGGAGVLSRVPILREAPFRLSNRGHLCQHVVLDLPAGALSLFNVHLTAPNIQVAPLRYDETLRERQAAALAARLAAQQPPVVVAGDFNMTERSTAYRRLAKLLRDSFREAGTGPGATFPNAPRLGPLLLPRWPVPMPVIRIDYVFHSADIVAREAHRGDGDGSDHCPVIATFAAAAPRRGSGLAG
jgi:endonuclease/exonuclease/phosphatase (EEP) superfamily protein YafD